MAEEREHELDLLTAALMGVAAGVLVTYLIRRGPSGIRPLMTGLNLAGRGMKTAGIAGMAGATAAGRKMAKEVRHGIDRGVDMIEDIPFDDLGDQLHDYMDAVKGAVQDTVSGELKDLKRTLRRQRRRFGI